MSKEDIYYRATITNNVGVEVNYNAALIRVVAIESNERETYVVLEPVKLNEESLNELAKTIVIAEEKFTPINPEDYPIMTVAGNITVRANVDFFDEVANVKAEPKDYTILGVKVRYDKEMRGFVMPDHTERVMCTPTGKQEVTPELPDMEDLYQYVLDYKINMYSHDTEFLQEIEKEEN